MPFTDNSLISDAQGVLGARLPAGWRTDLEQEPDTVEPRLDARLRVHAPDGRAAYLAVEAKRSLQPRGVLELRARIQELQLTPGEPCVVFAPYLSPAVRERLTESGLGFVDLTGNIRIALANPGLFIEAGGADVNPDRQSRASRSLRGDKAGRIVRALVDHEQPPGVRELAALADANPGYVSRIVALLDRQALLERAGRGRIVSVDWPRLLERWAEDAPLSTRGRQTMCLDPRGLAAMTSRLTKSKLRYAVTGTLAVSAFAPVAATHLAVVYVQSISDAVSELELRVAERGANVMLIETRDEGVYEGSQVQKGLRVVAVSQAAADLLTSPGRGPAEAAALMAWMRNNEEVWRG